MSLSHVWIANNEEVFGGYGLTGTGRTRQEAGDALWDAYCRTAPGWNGDGVQTGQQDCEDFPSFCAKWGVNFRCLKIGRGYFGSEDAEDDEPKVQFDEAFHVRTLGIGIAQLGIVEELKAYLRWLAASPFCYHLDDAGEDGSGLDEVVWADGVKPFQVAQLKLNHEKLVELAEAYRGGWHELADYYYSEATKSK